MILYPFSIIQKPIIKEMIGSSQGIAFPREEVAVYIYFRKFLFRKLKRLIQLVNDEEQYRV